MHYHEGMSSVTPAPPVIWAITLAMLDLKTHPVRLEWGFLAIKSVNQDYLIRSLETPTLLEMIPFLLLKDPYFPI